MLILPSQHTKWQDKRDLSGALLGATRFCAFRIVHMLILPSQHTKWQDERDLSGALLGATRFCALVQS
jgi:hypothetical protein